MALHIYNTLTGNKALFEPQVAGKVGIYVCGPTVYDMCHIGHARAYVAFDTVVRYLRRHYEVTYVRNFTDVDDKIIKRAEELGEPSTAVSERFIEEFKRDMAALNVEPADVEPKVTEHIPEIRTIISTLIAKGLAYESAGDVYYAVERFPTYGKLARRNLDDMMAGARVEVGEKKRHPMDFVLWKAAKAGEPSWPSPWGEGRPGWHIECSAMSSKYLGETFDIHGGGKDLIFPHHENEIAQSEAASARTYVHFWMHNGFVQIDNEKMSKSLGNFFTIRNVLEKFDPQTLRYYLLTTHYRSPINFSDMALAEAESRVRYLYETLVRLEAALGAPIVDAPDRCPSGPVRNAVCLELESRFEVAMEDDFCTPKVLADLAELFKVVNDVLDHPKNQAEDRQTLEAARVSLKRVGAVLGVFMEPPLEVLGRMDERRRQASGVDAAQVESLIAARKQARQSRNFARADEIRDELLAMGVVLRDSPTGTTWQLQ